MDDLAHSGALYPEMEFACNKMSGVDEKAIGSFHFYFAQL